MNVICLEDEAFYALVEEVYQRLKEKDQTQGGDKWVDAEEAMRMLRISSQTTLRDIRNRGKIRFSQPRKKIVLYDRDSILKYIEQNSNETF